MSIRHRDTGTALLQDIVILRIYILVPFLPRAFTQFKVFFFHHVNDGVSPWLMLRYMGYAPVPTGLNSGAVTLESLCRT